jgi:glycosyltransferase involved in cell wall biosynthesis
LKLVLVGRIGWGINSELKKYFYKLEKYLVFTDYIDIQDLKNLYFFSNSFILLSKYEGFGRTPLEAYLCRAKVIVSDIPIFKETLGDLAYYVDITNIEVAVKQIGFYLKLPCIEKFIGNNIFEVLDNKVISEIDILL